MQQTVYLTKIDEGAVIGDVLDHAFEHLAFAEAGDELGAGLGPGLLHHSTARDHNIAAAAIHLENLEGLLGIQQRRDIAHRTHVDLTARQEGNSASEINHKAALDTAEDHAIGALVVIESLFEHHPGFLAAGALAAQYGLATAVFHAVEKDLHRVANLDLSIVGGRGEFLQGHPALGLETDIDDRHLVIDSNHGPCDHSALDFFGIVVIALQKCRKILARRRDITLSAADIAHNVAPQVRLAGRFSYSARCSGTARCCRAKTSFTAAAKAASASKFVVSNSSASGVCTIGAVSRDSSRKSRSASSRRTAALILSVPRCRNSLWRRSARASALAVRKNFTSASGNTTLPISRPSSTAPAAPHGGLCAKSL